jgi:hypothetical protein
MSSSKLKTEWFASMLTVCWFVIEKLKNIPINFIVFLSHENLK